jgi:predicted glycoside hydrolase/deacetylase ChbG (UPF0249 family)
MTVFPELAREAEALMATATPGAFQIGLHVTLTGGFEPLAAAPLASADGMFPAIESMLAPSARIRINAQALADEIAAQTEAFRTAFGCWPAYFDGHQHVQLLPGVRKTFLRTVKMLAPRAWVRQCGPGAFWPLASADNKTRLLAWLSLGFRRLARTYAVPFNAAFAGAYDFRTAEPFAALFSRFIGMLPANTDGGLIMCHPGFVDELLRARDPLTDRREAEYAFLAGGEFDQVLAAAGARLA